MLEPTVAYACQFQQVYYGVHCSFDVWSYTLGLHWFWSKNQRHLLTRCSAGITCYQKSGPKRLSYFQQDSAPAHRARETIETLKRETPDFIPPTLWPLYQFRF